MRYAKSLLLLLGFAAAMFAADPFVGTWKMNPAKSKFKMGAPSKEQTVTIGESGGDLMVKVSGTAADGSPIALSYSVPSAGGPGKIDSKAYDGIVAKRMGPNERGMSYLKGGKEIYSTHSKLSADGKSLTVTSKGLNPIGKNVEGTIIYEKQ
jgi:hypothetical protein